ncbi:MAG: ABC transporter permease subunit [Ruminococcus sp.]|nr:ABC transporter permease subunit [Ruminococcus sp.]
MKEKWLSSDESVKTYDDTGLTGENGTLTVAVLPDNPPFSYTANNKLQGYAVELSTIFARKKGYRLVFEQANLASCIAGVFSGKYDILAYCLSYTEERAESIDYSDCIYNGGIVLMARTADIENNEAVSSAAASAPAAGASGEPSYTEYNGRRMGIMTGSSFEPITLEYFPDSEYMYFDSSSDLIAALRNDKIDGFLEDEPVAAMIHSSQSDINYLKKPVMDDDYHFLFRKNTERSNKLRTEFNELISELRSNGQLDVLKEKWLGSDESAKTVDTSGLTGENGEITVAVVPDGVPFSYTSNNELVGYAVELTTLYARKYGYCIKYEQANLAGCIAGLTSNKYDMLAGRFSYTDERAQSMDYSDVIYNGGVILAVRSADLEGSTASADDGTQAEQTVEDKSFFGSIKESFNKNFVREDRYKLILSGIGMTCMITVLSVVFGSVLAFLICLFRRADSLLAGKICDLYVKLLQGTPMVVLLMILYYVIFGKSGIAAMWVAVIGFSLNFGAYVSEILRSGIDSIDVG